MFVAWLTTVLILGGFSVGFQRKSIRLQRELNIERSYNQLLLYGNDAPPYWYKGSCARCSHTIHFRADQVDRIVCDNCGECMCISPNVKFTWKKIDAPLARNLLDD